MPVIGFLSNASPDLYSDRLRTFRHEGGESRSPHRCYARALR
jgi:hypothetical protein